MKIRDAGDADLEGLSALEERSFPSDRIAPRSLRRLIGRRTARIRVAAESRPGDDGAIVGYHLVLFRKGSTVARLYSIAVDDRRRGRGLGHRLLADAEALATDARRRVLRLEVRAQNQPAIDLYERRGYRRIGRYRRYYADKSDALRYEKPLAAISGDGRSPRRIRPRLPRRLAGTKRAKRGT